MYRAPPRPQDFDSLGWRSDAWGAWIELFDVVRPGEIEAIEVFRGLSQMPAEFRTHDSCAAVAIWTREGGRSQPEK
jgi:hypothetical protein